MKNTTLRTRLLAAILFIILITPGYTGAQETMRVNLSDGTVMEYAIDDIRKLIFDTTIGIHEVSGVIERFLTMKTYPNPASDHVNIEYSLAGSGQVTIELFNINGFRIHFLDRGWQVDGEYHYQWHTPHLPPGLYICRIWKNKENISEKIIIRK